MKQLFKKTAFVAVAMLLFSGATFAQIAMTRTTFNGVFTPVTTGTGGTLSTAVGDDVTQDGLPIGFTFNYLGTNYTTMGVSSNGWASFNTVGTNFQSANTNLYIATGPNLTLGPWWDDLTTDSIVYQTTGTPGSQVFTIQWNSFSYWTGASQRISYQVRLFEGTNVIEFHYAAVVPGTSNAGESASIGIEGATGGNGNYLDAVTGSYYCGQYFMQAATKWPTRYYRFTPGTPVAVPGGTYTVGTAGNYPTIDEAVADLNHRGVSGPVVLSLTQATYDVTPANGDNIFPVVIGPIVGTSAVNTITLQPASGTSTFFYDGSTGGGINNGTLTAACGTANEPILALCGAKYTLVNNINFSCSGTGVVDRGIDVINQSAAGTGAPNFGGSQFNVFTNIGVQLNRGNTSSIAIEQRAATAPSAATGANSSNAYMNLNISNTYVGIYLVGNLTFPDLGCVVGNTSPTAWNSIGSAAANDIGNGTLATYGIRCTSQSGVSVYNNEVRNLTVNAAVTCDGIFMELTQGNSNVYANKVHDLRNTSTTATNNIQGIRANVATTAGHNVRVYNNFIYGFTSGYTGVASATRQFKGIYAQSGGGGLTSSSINIDNNSVYLNGSSAPNISGTCMEIGTTSGPVINVRNNIFFNATGAQVAPAGHYGWVSTSATLTGNTGSVSNNNDLYISNATEGYVGRGNATNYATLANWQAGMVGQDVASLSIDPSYLSTTDLHISALGLDGVAMPIAWVTTDIDNTVRPVTPDMGADEFSPAAIDMGATVLVAPVAGGCYTASEPVTIRVRNYGTATIDYSVNPMTVTVNVTGAIVATINTTLNSGTLASTMTQDIVVGNINMSAAGTYIFNASTSVGADPNSANNAMSQTSIIFQPGTVVVSPPSVCDGSSATLTLSGNSSTSIQWQLSTDGGVTWNNIPGATTSPYVHIPTDTSWYRSVMCGLLNSTVDTAVWIDTTPPTTVNDTACGLTNLTMTATGAPVLEWYDAASGGTMVNTGSTYSVALASTDTFYVQSATGSGVGIHQTTYAAGNGSSGNAFTVKALSTITVTSFDGHLSSVVGTPSSWEIWYRPNDYLLSPGSQLSNVGWTQLGTATTPSAGPGNITPIPITFSLVIPAGQTYSFQIFTTTGNVAYTNGTALGALYNANADLEFYQGHGGTAFAGMSISPRVFNGRLHYTSGCQSARTPVIGVVIPAPAVTVASSNDVCSGGNSTLTSGSSNSGYAYTWGPAGSLNTTLGDTVIATPSGATTYTVTGTDTLTGCVDTAQVTVSWFQSPMVVSTVSDDTICSGASVNLDVQPIGSSSITIGTGTITNTNTSYPAPYGNFYWGSRHQMLILASELTAAGMAQGFITSMAFDVTNTNGTAPLDNYEVKIGTTALTTMSAFQGGLTSVFITPSYTPVTGANVHTFSAPFYWDGVSNIIIETCHNNAAYVANCSFNQSNTPFVSSAWFRADAAGVCGNPALTGTLAQRPNMVFTMLASYSYSWTPIASLDNPVIANPIGTPMVTTDYVVAVTDSINGCVTLDTATVTVNMTPAPAFGPDTTICDNATLMLDGTAGSYSYVWQDASTNQMYTVNNMAGTYGVIVTDTVTGCVGGDTIVVGIDIAPSFTLGNDTTVCAGASVTFNGPLNSNFLYVWSTGDTTASATTNAAGSHDLTVVDSTNGCFSSDSVMLNNNPLPMVALGADTAICSNAGALTLMGPAGAYMYMWSTLDSTQMIAVSMAGLYSVMVTDSMTGCMNSDTIAVAVNAAPSFTLGADTTFCSANGPITLMGPAGAYWYMWNDATTLSSLTTSTTGMYYVDVTDSLNGCMSTDSISVNVNMSPAPVVNDTTNCGTSVVISGPAGPYSYLWSTSGTSQMETVSASGTYALTVTDTATGCTGTDSAVVTLNANPTVTASVSSATVCADDADVTLTGTPAGGTFAGTSVTGNQFDPSVGAGSYNITYTYTDGNGCTGMDTVTVAVNACVGIQESGSVNGVVVYPNPANEMLNLNFAIAIEGHVNIEMFDAQGKLVSSQSMENISAGQVVTLNVTSVDSGIYFLKITGAESTNMFKLNVQH